MLVKGWMTTEVITIDPETSVMKASQIMKENGIRRLPVLEDGRLVGIISDRDLKEASPSKATTLDVHELYYLLSKLQVKEIMTKKVVTIRPDQTVELAAVKMLEHRISGLPVVSEEGRLEGILTMRDVFRVLISITGIYRGGVQFAFSLADRPGSIGEVANVIRKHGGKIVSILSSYDLCEDNCRNVYIRIEEMAEDKLEELVKELEENFIVLSTTKDQLQDI